MNLDFRFLPDIARHRSLLWTRPVHARWRRFHRGRIGTGWNPFLRRICLAQDPKLLQLFARTHVDCRDLNGPDDALSEQILAVAHDFLHIAAIAWMLELAPVRDRLLARRGAASVDELAFLMLVGEAVATVGLDYWYLSLGNPLQQQLGSMQRGYALSYSVCDDIEYLQFNSRWNTQRASFFVELATFYCTGRFVGFAAEDVRRSPKLHHWLGHELSYGATQRVYARQWLAYLHGEATPDEARAGAPVACDAAWQAEVIGAMGDRLWGYVKCGEGIGELDFPPLRLASSRPAANDWRFLNAGAFDVAAWRKGAADPTANYLLDQLLLLTPVPEDPELAAAIAAARTALGPVQFISLLSSIGLRPEVEDEWQLLFPS
jgi:hypothetical protein